MSDKKSPVVIFEGKEIPYDFYRLVVLRGALKLEIKGLKLSKGGRSAYVQLKNILNIRGSRASVLEQVTNLIDDLTNKNKGS